MINSFLIVLSLLLGFVTIAGICVSVIVFKRFRQISRQHQELTHYVKREITVINQAHVSMGKVLVHLEQQCKNLQQQVSHLQSIPNFSRPDPIKPEPQATTQHIVEEPVLPTKPKRNLFNEEFDSRYLNFSDEFSFQQRLQSGSYNEALHLLKQGVSAEEVAERCGLSRSEANLMQLVNSESSAN